MIIVEFAAFGKVDKDLIELMAGKTTIDAFGASHLLTSEPLPLPGEG